MRGEKKQQCTRGTISLNTKGDRMLGGGNGAIKGFLRGSQKRRKERRTSSLLLVFKNGWKKTKGVRTAQVSQPKIEERVALILFRHTKKGFKKGGQWGYFGRWGGVGWLTNLKMQMESIGGN